MNQGSSLGFRVSGSELIALPDKSSDSDLYFSSCCPSYMLLLVSQ